MRSGEKCPLRTGVKTAPPEGGTGGKVKTGQVKLEGPVIVIVLKSGDRTM